MLGSYKSGSSSGSSSGSDSGSGHHPVATLAHCPRPHLAPAEKWNLRVLFLISTVLGLVSMGSSLLLVGLVLDSPNPGSLFQKWGLPVPYYGKLVTMIYLKVSLSDFLTLFSARTEGPFWSMMPGGCDWVWLGSGMFCGASVLPWPR
jgi:hypothetical protein